MRPGSVERPADMSAASFAGDSGDRMMVRTSTRGEGRFAISRKATTWVALLGFAVLDLAVLPTLRLDAVAREPSGSAALRRDVEGYAFAACLTAQDSAYLKEQGHGWGAVVLERGHGGVEPLMSLDAAVKAAAARTPMALMHKDGPVSEPLVPLPILFCADLLQTPSVRAAKLRAMRRLRPDYHR